MASSIIVNVKSHANVNINDLKPFQGDLKTLSDENHNKLRKEIIENGFNFAPHIWKNDETIFILDGHQRIHVLKQLVKAGYYLVDRHGNDLELCVPVSDVHAENFADAKRKVLQAVSQYGKLDSKGFEEFTYDVAFDLKNFDFPDFEIPETINPEEVEPPDFKDEAHDFYQMTFILHNEQAEYVKSALKTMKEYEPYKGNDNRNGNALYGIIQEWEVLKI